MLDQLPVCLDPEHWKMTNELPLEIRWDQLGENNPRAVGFASAHDVGTYIPELVLRCQGLGCEVDTPGMSSIPILSHDLSATVVLG